MFFKKEYNRYEATSYALYWATKRNPHFYNYDKIGGDCTNFVSQCVYNGCQTMNYMPIYGWYYISSNRKSPSWTGVNFFFDFLVANNSQGPFGHLCDISEIETGDIIHLKNDKEFYHSVIVTKINGIPKEDSIYVCSHSIDNRNKLLSKYNYQDLRFIHIDGVKVFFA